MKNITMSDLIERQYRLLDNFNRLKSTPILSGNYPVSCKCNINERGDIIPLEINFTGKEGVTYCWNNIRLSTWQKFWILQIYTGFTRDDIIHYRFKLYYNKLSCKWKVKILLNSTDKNVYL